jgi:5-methyltetrahydropteroyltriglutamate--homocysteine methyltransferase
MLSKGIDFVPSNDFSLYDHVLDAAVMVGAVPARFRRDAGPVDLDCYFAMARGGRIDGEALAPLDLTKWFDTNYHHLVPELGRDSTFHADGAKACSELTQAQALGIATTPVLLGPLTLLLRSAAVDARVDVMKLLDPLMHTYAEILSRLGRQGASWVRLDEPALVEDRSADDLAAFRRVYQLLGSSGDRPNIVVSTYFGHVGAAMPALVDLPIEGIGLDLCRGRKNVDLLGDAGGLGAKVLFAGVVDGRNVWRNDLEASLGLLERLANLAGEVVVSTSCSLMHVPLGLGAEAALDDEVRPWLAFAEEKLDELATLARAAGQGRAVVAEELAVNRAGLDARRRSSRVVDEAIRHAAASSAVDPRRSSTADERAVAQRARLSLPALPTTTIGSFPQTPELRAARASWRAGRLDDVHYRRSLRAEIDRVVALQEEIGLDVLVHGEPERDDMVRYFAGQLTGFVLPQEGWVQSYGSRCVRPPVLFGDVARHAPMTLDWARYAQSCTTKPVKGMLTGPLTMLRWSFVRDDQPEAKVAAQLALAIRDELVDLQSIGIAVIQVDEPALREGLPLRTAERSAYLTWATRAFRLVTSAADPATQVHTHMCYAQLGAIVDALADLEVDVVSLEAARSRMALLDDLDHSRYCGGVGPGVYDVHSPSPPQVAELEKLLRDALAVVGPERLWVNPDCGLKTRGYNEVVTALGHMVAAARLVRATL